MGSRDLGLVGSAARLEHMIRQRGDYAHVQVQARAGHLVVKAQDSQGVQVIIARATPIGAGEYGLSYRTHAGRWEPMPVSGLMEQIVEGLLGFLGPHLDRTNLQ
jgi:hypothetical protein